MLARVFAFFAILVALTTTSTGLAQQRPPHGSTARVLYDRGIEAMHQGDWKAALTRFTESNAAKPTPAALEGVANALYNLGQMGGAYDAYLELAGKYPGQMSKDAGNRLLSLRETTGMLGIEVKGSGAAVALDDTALGSSPLTTMLRVSVGDHKVRVTTPGVAPVEASVKVVATATAMLRMETPVEPPPTTVTGQPTAKPPPTVPTVEPDTEAPPEQDPWNVPHGTRHYAGVRTEKAPKIDGVLDDPIWKIAPRDNRFRSIRSKPYGKPTTEPTEVQIAYDETQLYIAFTCRYSAKRERDDSFPAEELDVILSSEAVVVVIDGQHDHNNSHGFFVSRAGARADVEFIDAGQDANTDWRGIWESATHTTPDEWTAELRIPWSTAAVSSHDEPFDIGINMRRREPITGEASFWVLQPPAGASSDPNYYGHLSVQPPIRARQTLFLQPYLAMAIDQDAVNSGFRSRFYDFLGTGNNHFRLYGGLQLRYRPIRSLQIDGTFNPDFTSVNPDVAVTNLDRFEILFSENRPFFADDRARFEMGPVCVNATACPEGAQLFYSRRIGLETGLTGVTNFAPILYGTRVVYRGDPVQVSALNVGLGSSTTPDISMEDNITVIRTNRSFGKGRRIGNLMILRKGAAPGYMATGIDGAYTMFDEHLNISGFIASSATEGSPRGLPNDFFLPRMGHAQLGWVSQDFFAQATYLDIGNTFDGQLGFVPITGIRSGSFSAGYTPFLDNDLVRQVEVVGAVTRTRKHDDDGPIYDRGIISAKATMTNDAYVSARLSPSAEYVTDPFPIANNKIMITPGRYTVVTGDIQAQTAPRRKVEAGVGYTEGDVFNGYQHSPSANLGLNLGRLNTKVFYKLIYLKYGTVEAVGHQLSARATYSYTPLARTTLALEANTFTARTTVQLATSIGFGSLSTLSLVLRETAGINPAMPGIPAEWYSNPNFVAILSFAYGFTLF